MVHLPPNGDAKLKTGIALNGMRVRCAFEHEHHYLRHEIPSTRATGQVRSRSPVPGHWRDRIWARFWRKASTHSLTVAEGRPP